MGTLPAQWSADIRDAHAGRPCALVARPPWRLLWPTTSARQATLTANALSATTRGGTELSVPVLYASAKLAEPYLGGTGHCATDGGNGEAIRRSWFHRHDGGQRRNGRGVPARYACAVKKRSRILPGGSPICGHPQLHSHPKLRESPETEAAVNRRPAAVACCGNGYGTQVLSRGKIRLEIRTVGVMECRLQRSSKAIHKGRHRQARDRIVRTVPRQGAHSSGDCAAKCDVAAFHPLDVRAELTCVVDIAESGTGDRCRCSGHSQHQHSHTKS